MKSTPAAKLDTATQIAIWNSREGNLHYLRAVGRQLMNKGLLSVEGWYCGQKVEV